uniref:Putative secreted protein n=1 Tax=Rhipicephalus microplus TaxID=6941 RepID=A0A6M2DC01_RHIMP
MFCFFFFFFSLVNSVYSDYPKTRTVFVNVWVLPGPLRKPYAPKRTFERPPRSQAPNLVLNCLGHDAM